MKSIPLTRGLFVLVDDDTYEWARLRSWHANFPRKGGKPYARNGQNEYLHSLIMGPAIGADRRRWKHVDHRDGNTLNCLRDNLRMATPQQNKRGFRKKRANCTSCYRGVRWHWMRAHWSAQITVNGRAIHLGVFPEQLDAALAYNRAAKKFFGEFAHLNTPQPVN